MTESSRISSASPLAGQTVFIAGAGIAGLAFAISLKVIWRDDFGEFPKVIIYEREDGQPDISREGYTIGIRNKRVSSGLRVLQNMGVLDAILDVGVTREGSERGFYGLWSLDWLSMAKVRDPAPAGLKTSGIRVARSKLRHILLQEASQSADIVWGTACTSILPSNDKQIRVLLSNGREASCDFLVVADGANSKLRTCVRPDDNLDFAGPVSISAISYFSGPPPEPVNRDWGIVLSGWGVGLFASPMGEDRAKVKQIANWSISYMARTPRKEERQPLSRARSVQLLKEAQTLGEMFREPFDTLVEHSDISSVMVFNAMDKEPFAHGEQNGITDGIVFIGDSNHAVSPFAGNGANLALKDGYDLAECLCTYQTVQEAVRAYDERSMPRAARSLWKSHLYIAVVHSSGLWWLFCKTMLTILGYMTSVWYGCKDCFVTVFSRPSAAGTWDRL